MNWYSGNWPSMENPTEITAIPKLLELLDLKKAVVTIDAMGIRRRSPHKSSFKRVIILLAVKDNQKTLHEKVGVLMNDIALDQVKRLEFRFSMTIHEKTETGHGRIRNPTRLGAANVGGSGRGNCSPNGPASTA